MKRRAKSVVALAGSLFVIVAAGAGAGPASAGGSQATVGQCDPLSIGTTVDHAAPIQLHCVRLPGIRLDYAIVSEPRYGTVSLDATTGQAIYTPAAGYSGPDSFSYRGYSLDRAANATVSIGVGRKPAVAPPTIANAAQSRSTWREGKRLATFSRKRPPVGTTFSFTLNERASVSFAFTQRVVGRSVNSRCVPRTSANRHEPSCNRTVLRGRLSFTGHSGTNKVAFQGRLSRARKLALGRFTLIIKATNAARKQSSARALHFTIVR